MSLYEDWVRKAYDKDGKSIKKVWDEYLPQEEKIYKELLSEKATNLSGTLTELTEKFGWNKYFTIGFLDGINEATDEPLVINDLTDESQVSLNIDFEKLYKKMVQYKAQHLYSMPEWNGIFDEETRKNFLIEQRKSGTVINDEKIGRNDPCKCGSGKKYKKCCGAAV